MERELHLHVNGDPFLPRDVVEKIIQEVRNAGGRVYSGLQPSFLEKQPASVELVEHLDWVKELHIYVAHAVMLAEAFIAVYRIYVQKYNGRKVSLTVEVEGKKTGIEIEAHGQDEEKELIEKVKEFFRG